MYDSDSFGFVPLSVDSSDSHALRNLAFLRRTYIDADFPLDSIVHLTEEHWTKGEIIPSNGHRPFGAGFVVVPASRAEQFSELLRHADSNFARQSGNPGGGDQLIMIRELSLSPHYLLDRRWQVIWPEYIAEHRPDLYARRPVSRSEAALAVASAMFSAWCIHFATSWPEKQYWSADWESAWAHHFGGINQSRFRDYRCEQFPPVDYGRILSPNVRMID